MSASRPRGATSRPVMPVERFESDARPPEEKARGEQEAAEAVETGESARRRALRASSETNDIETQTQWHEYLYLATPKF